MNLCTCDGGKISKVDYEKLSGGRVMETSQAIHAQVQAARDIRQKRFRIMAHLNIICNADRRGGEIWRFCKLQDEGQILMRVAKLVKALFKYMPFPYPTLAS